ncbi:response regulator [Paenibacillus sp. L3-i20]|uniref:response regulator transcription factor n=1 Tax=Paenibacillus sp. L3-i20 TaxID=2905833 RepID=UPI001EDF2C72|nr:response regulator [Paenibacillus sp. L3-i20]GKU80600.1 hypothetical protein L3i20_v249970 [Paenibacillus sp. L3-i20]
MHILVVDDEKTIREGLKRTIQTAFEEIEVSTAASALDALRILLLERVHIVFLDIMMPNMNGLELLAQVRHTYKDIKWIVISAHSEFAYAQEALRLGAKDYFLKPFGKDQIVQTVTDLHRNWLHEQSKGLDQDLLELNLNYLREAVFRRWIQGLDIGRFDLTIIRKEYEQYYLIAVKLECNPQLTLQNFIVENVMTEYMSQNGKGFIVNMDGDFLAGVLSLEEGYTARCFREGAVTYLSRCLKVPYLLYMSELLTDFGAIPQEIRKFNSSTIAEVDHGSMKGKSDAIDTALQYMKSSYKENLSLELVASIVYLNPVYFSKLFKQRIGIGYKEYVTNLRMERAKELLMDSNLTITKIGELVGYPDVRHFTQVFRKSHNCTPSHYRTAKVLI